MTLLLHSSHDSDPRCLWAARARVTGWLVAGLVLAQLSGCAARLWPPSDWTLSVDLPFKQAAAVPPPADPPPEPAAIAPWPLKEPSNAREALAYVEALCALRPAELAGEIERLETLQTQSGHTPLRSQQLAFARQLAQLYAEQDRLQESNERLAQQLQERQRQIEQLNGQIEAMRAVEYSLPAASTSPVPTPVPTTSPVAPLPATTGAPGTAPPPASWPKASAPPRPAASPGKAPTSGNGNRGHGDTTDRSTNEEGPATNMGEEAPTNPKR